MKRCLTKLVVFLLLGAIVNVAVAWGCALWSRNSEWREDRPLPTAKTLWPQYLLDADWPPAEFASLREGVGFGVTIIDVDSEVRVIPGQPDSFHTNERGVLTIYRNGWPFRSLQWELHGTGGPRALELVRDAKVRAGWRRGLASPSILPIRGERWARRLPVVPLASGLIFNTLLYSALLWLLTFGPFAVRRFIRDKRGRCIKCGYDLRGDFSAGCPECGWRRDVGA